MIYIDMYLNSQQDQYMNTCYVLAEITTRRDS